MSSLRKVSAILIALGFSFSAYSQRSPEARPEIGKTMDEYFALPGPSDRSPSQNTQAVGCVERLGSLDREKVDDAIFDRIALGPGGKDLVKCKFLLQHLEPSIDKAYFARLASESIPQRKARLIRLADAFWGTDAMKVLAAQLDDRRPTDLHGWERSIRVCDIATNVLYKNLRGTVRVRIGLGGDGGDAIVPDVSLPKRDEWIATLKTALIAKYGPNLDMP